MGIHKIETGPHAGRFIRADWDAEKHQWQSNDLENPEVGYRFSVSRKLEGLAEIGIRTYLTDECLREFPPAPPSPWWEESEDREAHKQMEARLARELSEQKKEEAAWSERALREQEERDREI